MRAFKTRPQTTKSGIPGLDEVIEGGFPRGSILSVTGDTGSGKTVFAIEFLYNGATKYNEPGLYISFDEQKKPMFRNMLKFGWDLAKLEKEKKLLFIEYPPYEVENFVAQENVIRDLVNEIGVERLVIDSIIPLALLYETEQKRRQGLLKIIEKVRQWDCTTFLISESIGELSIETPHTRFGVECLADGLIFLYNKRKGTGRARGLEIVKLRGVEHATRIMPMEVTKKGVALYPKKKFASDQLR
ncbi:hypothetical protein HY570_00105 [Candidatus Micrarchaeota archaeon]|nr:hypothetical protein [Candidatus Micrarchaeota archaeon]